MWSSVLFSFAVIYLAVQVKGDGQVETAGRVQPSEESGRSPRHVTNVRSVDEPAQRNDDQVAGESRNPPLTSSTKHRRDIRSATVRNIDGNWNDIVDLILRDAKRGILAQNLDEIPLPDVVEEFKRKWSFILIDARFVANRGWIKSFSSLLRHGNASMVGQGTIYTLTSHISMSVAKIRYQHYDVEVWEQSIFSGEIRGNIGTNRMRVIFNFEMRNGECISTLRELKVVEIGDFEVAVTGLGPIDELASQISSWVSKKREGQIVKEIEYYLSKEIRKALEDFHCDEYATLLNLSL